MVPAGDVWAFGASRPRWLAAVGQPREPFTGSSWRRPGPRRPVPASHRADDHEIVAGSNRANATAGAIEDIRRSIDLAGVSHRHEASRPRQAV
jgi:hypothetical protein